MTENLSFVAFLKLIGKQTVAGLKFLKEMYVKPNNRDHYAARSVTDGSVFIIVGITAVTIPSISWFGLVSITIGLLLFVYWLWVGENC